MSRWHSLSSELKQYLLITGNYWVFTLSDGALRMLVVLYFHTLGYDPLSIAALFLFYEAFGVVTNLLGGWLGAAIGLNRTMHIGTGLQLVALGLLLLPTAFLSIPIVMASQALSGIAKDLNKMSAKSAIKGLVSDQHTTLFRWVAILTGSKNALKGVGFFLGGALLGQLGFHSAILCLLIAIAIMWLFTLTSVAADLGRAKHKPAFKDLLSVSRTVNILSAARFFLFASRDIWFVVALPVWLASEFGWDFWRVGALMAAWVIGYGLVQAITPRFFDAKASQRAVTRWGAILTLMPLGLAYVSFAGQLTAPLLILLLASYAALFAINSSLHSYLIVAAAKHDGVSLDVGFYYMSNAAGRLVGTIISGALYQFAGLGWCLVASAIAVALSSIVARKL
jgi:hypothetical protein